MDAYAAGREKIGRLADEYRDLTGMNEANTRIRIIDGVLYDCLGWTVDEISNEEYFDGEYADYSIGKPSTNLILEAKREGITFTLPAGIAGRRSVDLQTAIEDEKTRSAITQVMGYCHSRGVPMGAIFNGHQLLAFYASRQDNLPPLKGTALCFSSLDEMVADFQALWNNLSPAGMASRNLQRILLAKTAKSAPPQKLADMIENYPGFRTRTDLETNLKIIGGLLVQDLLDEDSISDDFIKYCYCSSGALSQYAMVSREILRSRYTQLRKSLDVEARPVRDKYGISPQLSTDMVAAAMSRRPLILLGDVGVGKTMFLQHLIRVQAADILSNALVFYVNFGKEPALATNLEAYVHRRMIQQLEEDYELDIFEDGFVRAVYNGELNKFRRGIYKSLVDDDPAEYRRRELARLSELTETSSAHLRRSLEHIRGASQRQSVIVLDNIDQRPLEFQDRVFVIAQSLAGTWPSTVFVALRPSTFHESKQHGSLAAYQLRVFTVEPTRVDEVITRRLQFARLQLEGPDAGSLFPENLALTHEDLKVYLDVLVKAFKGNDELKTLLDNLSGGNLRQALTFLSSFVGSAYVSTRRVLETAGTGRLYVIPMHEFMRAIIFGESDYYDPQASEICNLFDITMDDGREHFLLPSLLAFIQRSGEIAGGDGFVAASEVFDCLQSMGYLQEQIGAQLERGLVKRLIECPPGKSLGGPFRITTIGGYMYKTLLQNFVYVDAMIVDTPIVDVVRRRNIGKAQSIFERLGRAEEFKEYLDEQWDKLGEPANAPFDWPGASVQLGRDLDNARDRAERAQDRRQSEKLPF